MGARGPKKGQGGRPRKAVPEPGADGYVRVSVGPPGQGKREYLHRVVAREAWGDGPQECAYCGREVFWDHSWPQVDALVVDHVDEDHSNNAIENLVASCGECNSRRSAN